MILLQMERIHQCVFFNLRNHCEYRFTVTIKTAEGYSMESRPSNMVYIDTPAPVGWKLLYDQSSKQYYYFNNFFRFSQITRPEDDPYFIENHVAICFSKREIRKFKEVWIEEMMHFEKMTHLRLKEVLYEMGEDTSPVSIRDHMKVREWKKTLFVQRYLYVHYDIPCLAVGYIIHGYWYYVRYSPSQHITSCSDC